MARTIQEVIQYREVGPRKPVQPDEEPAELPLGLLHFDEWVLRKQPPAYPEFTQGRSGGDRVTRILAGRLLRVLVVDDNEDNADVPSMLLGLWGHETRVAYTGAAALEIVSDFQPDVFLLDIGMPGMSGGQLAQHLRREHRFQYSLLIAVTGYADGSHRRLCEEAGFDLYLVKPVDPSDLETLLLLELDRLSSSPAEAAGVNGNGCQDDFRALEVQMEPDGSVG